MRTARTFTNTATLFSVLAVGAAAAAPNPESRPGSPRPIAQVQSTKPASAAKAALAARRLAQEERTMPADAAPQEAGAALILNLQPLFRSTYATLPPDHARFAGFLGRQVIDGVPFQIDGDITLYGKTLVERGTGEYRLAPRLIRGVRVGRAFEELHLLHAAAWPDLEGQPIAIFTLHYRDGTTAELPIAYGAHVRDGMRLLTEENETLTNPDTKIVWRGPGPGSAELRAVARLFKSLLRNPQPEKIVDTIDLKSAGEPLASYRLIAATVTPRDVNRAITPPLPLEVPRIFDGRLLVRVVNSADGQPMPNALIVPGLRVTDVDLIGTPLLASPEGTAVMRYSIATTNKISLRASKDGSFSPLVEWQPGTASIVVELNPAGK